MIPCFFDYFKPIGIYLKNVYSLAASHDGIVFKSSLIMTGTVGGYARVMDLDIFGVSNFLLILVLGTVAIDAVYGVAKSRKIAYEYLAKAKAKDVTDREYLVLMQRYESNRFNIARLQFTFFKCFTLMGYLFFVKNLLADGDGFFDFTAAILTKTPLAIFWYYEFKSIGNNSAYIYGKKAPIFWIAEGIFEMRILKFFNKEKPDSNE